jgi:subtilisin-like proprotein convertase family protein
MIQLSKICLLLSLSSAAWAVPAQLTHQGRFVDSAGSPLTDDTTITFRLVDSDSGGTTLWDEEQIVGLTNGFYSVVLGADEDGNPLETDVLEQWPLWLEIQIAGKPAMVPRLSVGSAAYARVAGIAEEVAGGPVDASEVSIDGTVVIDETGAWVGPAAETSLGWSDVTDIPSDFADGVDDDTQRTDEEIREAVTGSAIDVADGSTMGGVSIATTADLSSPGWSDIADIPSDFADGIDNDTDSFAELGTSCTDGAVPSWDAVLGSWACGSVTDSDTLAGLGCTTGQLASFDSTLAAWACTDPSAGVGGTSGLRSTAADLTVGESNGGAPFASLDTPLSIPDDNTFGVTSTRYVADAATVETISVDIEVTHGDMSQVTVVLGSPTGTEITLYSEGEAGSADLNTNIGWVTAPSTGDLYSFFDENPVGTWTLQVVDTGAGTEGTLDSWTLRINEEWDGTAFVGQSLTVQGKAEVRGQLTMAAGAPIVFSDVDGDETMRIDPTGMTPLYKMAGGCVSSMNNSSTSYNFKNSQDLLTLSPTCTTVQRSTSSNYYWNCAGTTRVTTGSTTCTNVRVGSMLLGD